jgi:hypothetical protein
VGRKRTLGVLPTSDLDELFDVRDFLGLHTQSDRELHRVSRAYHVFGGREGKREDERQI